jgi:threonine synthase
VIQAEGAAPLAALFAAGGALGPRLDDVATDALAPVEHPQTLASAIKIGSPVSWRKALRAVLWTGGHVISVSEQEIADAKAVIGRDGIGCEPASATTVAGIKKLVAAGHIAPHESIVAVLTGHVLKDTDYAINYHRETLYTHDRAADGNKEDRRLTSTYANHAARVKASGAAILEHLANRER